MRAPKAGINADVQAKVSLSLILVWPYTVPLATEMRPRLQREASYSKEEEKKARFWMEQVMGEEVKDDLFEFLHDGTFLCRYATSAGADIKRTLHKPYQLK